MEAPSILTGRYPRSGIKYRDLSCHLLTGDERLFICWDILGANLPSEISPSTIPRQRLKLQAQRYNIDIKIITEWLRYFLKGNLIEETAMLWLNQRGRQGPASSLLTYAGHANTTIEEW